MKGDRVLGIVIALAIWLSFCGTGTDPAEPEVGGEANGSYVETLGRAYHGGFADRTRGDLQAIANALNARMVDAGGYPVTRDMAELAAHLEPSYIRSLPRTDGWGNPLRYESDGSGFTLASSGKNGAAGDADDIVMTDGGFR